MKHIPLTQGKFAIVDDDMYDYLMQWKWYAWKCRKTYYARRNKFPVLGSKRRACIYMHRVVSGATHDKLVDHIDHNGLDNRVCNIRTCSQAQNQQNQIAAKTTGESKHKGVSRSGNRWRARIQDNGKRVVIGSYSTEVEAATAYNKKAKVLFGEYAHLNMIRSLA